VKDVVNPIRLPAVALVVVAGWFVLVVTGCSSGPPPLMPTPNVYATGQKQLFTSVPPELQNNRVEVIYLTDRKDDSTTPGTPKYGFKRSRSLAFGVADVEFGENVSWPDLVKASTESKRTIKLPMRVVKTTELIRFPPTPKVLVEAPEVMGTGVKAASQPSGVVPVPTTEPSLHRELRLEIGRQAHQAVDEIKARLAKTPSKEIYLFVHGYNNTFDDGVTTIAEIWHFLGREGVPIAYTWPAGRGGLRGYTYDRESSEFTVYHLKQCLRVLAAIPEVEHVNIISHSRGTDVTASALRELHLEIAGTDFTNNLVTRQQLKLGTVVLAAPDLDTEVVIQRMVTARLGRVPERFVMYCCANDKALGLATWLFEGTSRLGKLKSDMFTPEELASLRDNKTVQIVNAKIKNAGAFGHDYFHSNPAVSSDLILAMRYHLQPGDDTGRPLGDDKTGFWTVNDKYPTQTTPTADVASQKK
jgi:esterase/lipase superfamily enzyme